MLLADLWLMISRLQSKGDIMKKISIVLLLIAFAASAFAQGTIVVWGSPHNQVAKNVPSGDDFIGIAAGNAYGIGLRADGSLASWGQANTIVNSTPAGTNFTAISAGDQHAIALREDGSVVGWGNNSFGQTNTPPFTDFVKISAGINHNLGLRANGEVYAWGNNANGQCNVPAGTYLDIAGGNTYSIGLTTGGEVVAWGSGWNGELDTPAGNDFVQVSAKFLHAIARRADGSIVAWGNPTDNIIVPAGSYTDMAAGWQGNVAIRDDEELVSWANLWALKTVPEWVNDLTIVKVAAGNSFFLGLTGEFGEADADADGVADNLDEYPDDPLRAYNISYPLDSSTGWGTLAYEDMWPAQGDYDFNDLVLGYKLSLVLDADMKVKDINGQFQLRAVGATFQNAFAIEFPFASSNVETLVGNGNSSPYNMPIIEADTHFILKVISNTNDFVSVPGGDIFWNSQPEQPHYDVIPIDFQMTLSDSYDMTTAPSWGIWNPYLMVNRVLGHEVHLPGYPPTMHADTSLFGMDDDSTDPAQNRYYKTTSNLPWALDLPINWRYPIERKQISHAYLGFAPWAESGGAQYPNWYEMIPSQIDANLIYNP